MGKSDGWKHYTQRLLKRAGIYQRLKASRVYVLYWSVADRSIIARRNREIRFYRSLLDGFRRGCLIFDVGANHGTKTDIFLNGRVWWRLNRTEPINRFSN